jgi:hypothetical protein
MYIVNMEIEKRVVEELIKTKAERVKLEKPEKGKSSVWSHFNIVRVDGKLSGFVICNSCAAVLK